MIFALFLSLSAPINIYLIVKNTLFVKLVKFFRFGYISLNLKSREIDKDYESIQSNTIPDPEHHKTQEDKHNTQ